MQTNLHYKSDSRNDYSARSERPGLSRHHSSRSSDYVDSDPDKKPTKKKKKKQKRSIGYSTAANSAALLINVGTHIADRKNITSSSDPRLDLGQQFSMIDSIKGTQAVERIATTINMISGASYLAEKLRGEDKQGGKLTTANKVLSTVSVVASIGGALSANEVRKHYSRFVDEHAKTHPDGSEDKRYEDDED